VPDDNVFNIQEADKIETILTKFRDTFAHLSKVYEEGVEPVDTLMEKLLAHYDKDATGAAPMQVAPPAVQAAPMQVAQPQAGVEETKVRHLLWGCWPSLLPSCKPSVRKTDALVFVP
jgi:hypothetical protein